MSNTSKNPFASKKLSLGLASAALVAVATLAAVPAFSAPPTDQPTPGSGSQTQAQTAPLTDAEKADLASMREEERLAKELYQALGEKWDVTEFTKIATSEQRHFDALGRVLTRHQLPDPSATTEVGKYADPALQKLWDDWHARGMESKDAAFAVAIELEKADIDGLKKAIDTTDNAHLDRVFGKLLKGSENHLKAFEALSRGETPTNLGEGGRGERGRGRGHAAGDPAEQGQAGKGRGQRAMDPENCPGR